MEPRNWAVEVPNLRHRRGTIRMKLAHAPATALAALLLGAPSLLLAQQSAGDFPEIDDDDRIVEPLNLRRTIAAIVTPGARSRQEMLVNRGADA
jgi:hypothetical protein